MTSKAARSVIKTAGKKKTLQFAFVSSSHLHFSSDHKRSCHVEIGIGRFWWNVYVYGLKQLLSSQLLCHICCEKNKLMVLFRDLCFEPSQTSRLLCKVIVYNLLRWRSLGFSRIFWQTFRLTTVGTCSLWRIYDGKMLFMLVVYRIGFRGRISWKFSKLSSN